MKPGNLLARSEGSNWFALLPVEFISPSGLQDIDGGNEEELGGTEERSLLMGLTAWPSGSPERWRKPQGKLKWQRWEQMTDGP